MKIAEGLEKISIKGAREHNLKNVSLTIPRDKLTVITGLSGSGKSSLAFDTIFAEGQRRYVECLSPYARQFMGVLKKPDVDSIEGLSPAISIEQKTLGLNPRSTVGTVTEIYDYLRLLYAKLGTQFCLKCDIPVVKKPLDKIIEEISTELDGAKIQILSPIVRGRKGHYKELFEQLIKTGFTKARIDGQIRELLEGIQLARYKAHDIELVIDRLIVDKKSDNRLSESIELALFKGEGTMSVIWEGKNQEQLEKLYSTSLSCPKCGSNYPSPAPNSFSFNSPYGYCKSCDGLGYHNTFSLDLLCPDKTKSLDDGAVFGVDKSKHYWLYSQAESFLNHFGFKTSDSLDKLSDDLYEKLFWGYDAEELDTEYNSMSGKNYKLKQKYNGIIPALKSRYDNVLTPAAKKTFDQYMSTIPCHSCHSGRLKPESLFIRIQSKNIHEVCSLDIPDTILFFKEYSKSMNGKEKLLGHLVVKEIINRLEFLQEVGLDYMMLNRSARTLSGGEAQRIRLASQIGSKLTGVLYVLDEPSIGLHQHDNDKLISSLKNLRDLGNTLIVVEHDKAMIEEADYLIDIGPGAGVHGGEIILQSEPKNLNKLHKDVIEQSSTAKYLSNLESIKVPNERREGNGKKIELKGCTGNNLLNVDLELELGKMICITGMSGSGKSSLINDTLVPIISKTLNHSSAVALPYKSISGLEHIDKMIEIDQAPIGRTPRSNPATYTGLFTQIRDFFTMMPESKIRGYKSGRFSFNVPGGRCEDCEGAGMKKIELNFLPEVYVTCETCNGQRYNQETLSVKYKGKSIAEVLDMPVEEACLFFSEIPKIYVKLKILNDVGLGYIKLGQQAPTLSGGEAQRVKLSTELSKRSTGKTLYLLDEPTTGLHFKDIQHLMNLLNALVDKGNTVVIIEHNLDVIKCADWIIDVGPGGGKNGGKIIACGTPEQVAKSKVSITGKYLKKELSSKK